MLRFLEPFHRNRATRADQVICKNAECLWAVHPLRGDACTIALIHFMRLLAGFSHT